MSFALPIAVYLIVWSITLFAILPFGRTPPKPGEEQVSGADPGSPGKPRGLWILGMTTLISSIVYAGIVVAHIYFGL